MLEQASQMKAIAPGSQVWVYRNLVQAYLLRATLFLICASLQDIFICWEQVRELRAVPREARGPTVRGLLAEI